MNDQKEMEQDSFSMSWGSSFDSSPLSDAMSFSEGSSFTTDDGSFKKNTRSVGLEGVSMKVWMEKLKSNPTVTLNQIMNMTTIEEAVSTAAGLLFELPISGPGFESKLTKECLETLLFSWKAKKLRVWYFLPEDLRSALYTNFVVIGASGIVPSLTAFSTFIFHLLDMELQANQSSKILDMLLATIEKNQLRVTTAAVICLTGISELPYGYGTRDSPFPGGWNNSDLWRLIPTTSAQRLWKWSLGNFSSPFVHYLVAKDFRMLTQSCEEADATLFVRLLCENFSRIDSECVSLLVRSVLKSGSPNFHLALSPFIELFLTNANKLLQPDQLNSLGYMNVLGSLFKNAKSCEDNMTPLCDASYLQKLAVKNIPLIMNLLCLCQNSHTAIKPSVARLVKTFYYALKIGQDEAVDFAIQVFSKMNLPNMMVLQPASEVAQLASRWSWDNSVTVSCILLTISVITQWKDIHFGLLEKLKACLTGRLIPVPWGKFVLKKAFYSLRRDVLMEYFIQVILSSGNILVKMMKMDVTEASVRAVVLQRENKTGLSTEIQSHSWITHFNKEIVLEAAQIHYAGIRIWKEENNWKFPKRFRDVVKTLLMVSNRLARSNQVTLPKPLWLEIFKTFVERTNRLVSLDQHAFKNFSVEEADCLLQIATVPQIAEPLVALLDISLERSHFFWTISSQN